MLQGYKYTLKRMKAHNGTTPDYSIDFKEEIIVNTSDGKASAVEHVTVYEASTITPKRKRGYDAVHVLTTIIIICSMIVAGVGLFNVTGGEPYSFTNQYGDEVRLYGKGLYLH